MEKQNYALSEIETASLFETLWAQRNSINAQPILLKNIASSYGLPIKLGFREVTNFQSNAEHDKHGFVFSLFEDRSEVSEEKNLQTLFSDRKRRLLGQKVYDEAKNVRVAPVECLGWLVISDNIQGVLSCWNSDLINLGFGIDHTNLKNDLFFLSLAQHEDIDALSVGFKQRFSIRRRKALKKLGPEIAAIFTDYDNDLSDFNQKRRMSLHQRLHIQKGLGTILLKQALHLAQHEESRLQFIACSHESTVLLTKFAQKYNKQLEKISGRGNCFELI